MCSFLQNRRGMNPPAHRTKTLKRPRLQPRRGHWHRARPIYGRAGKMPTGIIVSPGRWEINPAAYDARRLKRPRRQTFRHRVSASWPAFTVGGVETFRVRQENTLAGPGAEINFAPMKIRLRVISRVAANGAVADGFGECQLFFPSIRRRDEEEVTFSSVIHI